MNEPIIYTITALAPLLLILFGLAITVIIDPYINRRQRIVLLLIVILTVIVLLQNGMGYLLEVQIVNPLLRTWSSIVGYSVRPVILVLFLYIVGFEFKSWPLWVLVAVNCLIHMTALMTGRICFGFLSNNFYRGPLGFTSHVVSGVLLALLLFQTIRKYRGVKRAEMWIPIGSALLIVVSVVLESVVFIHLVIPVSLLTMSMVCSTLFYYIWLHLQFVREHERDLMASQRIQIMMTQIQPHFLYNTLSTIQALCRTDPEKAFTVTEKLGTYLRQNLDSLNQMELIPIRKELEHTRIYAEIEAVRFPRIRIEYEIEDTGFSVPALTVQPLVENAIRHGVRIRQNGLVTVAVRRGTACHEIVISDNGKGFDTEASEQAGEAHIGIRNVRERVETMCGGSLTIDSRIGEGTTVTIRIPAGRENTAEKGT